MVIVGSSLWLLMKQSDAATWCILLVLLGMSIICWTIALYKLVVLRKLIHEVRIVLQGILRCETLQALDTFYHQMPHVAGSGLLGATNYFVRHGVKIRDIGQARDALLLLRDELDASINESVSQVEDYTTILKTSAEAAPLLGLLGTIWGLIHSFIRISVAQSADITTVAPGIAEALITTLMGLLVAIPALIMFHMIYRKIQIYEQELVVIAEQCERIVRYTQLKEIQS